MENERVIDALTLKKFLVYDKGFAEIDAVSSTFDDNYWISLANGERLLRSREEIEKLGL